MTTATAEPIAASTAIDEVVDHSTAIAEPSANGTAPAAAETTPPGETTPPNGETSKTQAETADDRIVNEAAARIAAIRQEEYNRGLNRGIHLGIGENTRRNQQWLKCTSSKLKMERLKKELAESKAEHEKDLLIYAEMMNEEIHPLPLFDADLNAEKSNGHATPAPSQATATTTPPVEPDESWRPIKLSQAIGKERGVTEKVLEKLAAGNVTTIGEFVDFEKFEDGKQRLLTDIQGIGETTRAKLADAMIEFWKKNPQFRQPAPVPAAEPAATPAPEDETTTPAPTNTDATPDHQEDDDRPALSVVTGGEESEDHE